MKKTGCLFTLLVVLFLVSCASRNSTANLASKEHTLSSSPQNTEQPVPDSGCKEDAGTVEQPVPVRNCKEDTDCTLTNEGCCPCSSIGKKIAISGADKNRYDAQVQSTLNCKKKVCAMIVDTWDPSCAKNAKAECNKDTGLCQLAKNQKPTDQ